MPSSNPHWSVQEPPHLASLDGFSLDDSEPNANRTRIEISSRGGGSRLDGCPSHGTHSDVSCSTRNYDSEHYSHRSSATHDSNASRQAANCSDTARNQNSSKRLSFQLPTPAQILAKMAYVALYADVNLMTAIPAFGDASLISTFLEMTKSLGSNPDEISSFSVVQKTVSPVEKTLREALAKSPIPIARILFHEPSLQELIDGSFLRLHSAFFNTSWTVFCDDLTPETIIDKIAAFTGGPSGDADASSTSASSTGTVCSPMASPKVDPSLQETKVPPTNTPSPDNRANVAANTTGTGGNSDRSGGGSASTPDVLIEAFAKIGMPPERDAAKSSGSIFPNPAPGTQTTSSTPPNPDTLFSKFPGPPSNSDVQETPWKIELSHSCVVMSPLEESDGDATPERESSPSVSSSHDSLPMQFSNSFGVWNSRVHPEDRPGLYKACGKAIILRLPSFHLRCRWSVVNYWKLVDLDYSLEYGPTGVLRAVLLMIRPVDSTPLEPLDGSTGRNWFQQILPANAPSSTANTPVRSPDPASEHNLPAECDFPPSATTDKHTAHDSNSNSTEPVTSGTSDSTAQSTVSQNRKNRLFSRSPVSPYLRSTRLRKEDSIVRAQYNNSRPTVARISGNTDSFGVSFDTPPIDDELLTIGLPRLPQFDDYEESVYTSNLDDPVHDWSSPTALDACFDMLLASKKAEESVTTPNTTDGTHKSKKSGGDTTAKDTKASV